MKMNVLFVVVDDLRTQLGCYGIPWIHSPNIDNLSKESLLFERAYCQQAVCAPSRCSVLSGCRPDTTTIYDLQTPLRKAMPYVLSLPEHFKANGYETVSIGKVYHHAKDDLQGWSKEPLQSSGDWKGRGYLTDEAIEAIARCDKERKDSGDRRQGLGPAFEAADVPDDAYHDGKDALAAIAELRELSKLDRPFFLGLGFHKPHLPFNAPKRYWEMYDREALPLAVNPFEPNGVTEFSLTNFGEMRGYFGIPKEGDIPEDLARDLIHGYCACVSYMDAQLGKVLDELKQLGLWDNTVIMFWGDHGWKLGEHNSWSKHTNFEVDTRAPLLARTPAMKAEGRTTNELVEFVDMYPTLCELCGLNIPDHCEGDSFAPLLDRPNLSWKKAAFSQYPRKGIMGYAMRTDQYRYIEWRETDSQAVRARELYDHSKDSQENVNLIDQVNESLIDALSRQLRAGWEQARLGKL
ncbi:MAG: sulfatase [Lentisphaerae bacterium]|nr:sulfatase [Lentisphaerota bacterium]